jgi:hypothetical protein
MKINPHRQYPNQILLKDTSRLRLLKMVQKKEKEGFECVKKIYSQYIETVNANNNPHDRGSKYRRDYSGSTYYFAPMKKVTI